MTVIEMPQLEQGSEEWLEARRGLVTASVVGQLITPKTVKPANNDYSRALIASLAAERVTGWTEPVWVTADMQRGIDDEPVARDLYSEHFAPVTETGFMVREEPDWKLGFSPDGLVGNDGLIEVKSRKPKKHLQTVVSGEVPLENVAQVQAGLLVTGRRWLDYVSICGGMELFVKRVYPDLVWFEAIEAAVKSAEDAITELVTRYRTGVVGMPKTERRIEELEMVI